MDVLEHIEELITTPQEVATRRRYKRGLEWDWSSPEGFSAAIESSILADPLPTPPPMSTDPLAEYALNRCPDLFKVVCLIDSKFMNHLLSSHPNQDFVKSVIRGLDEGFWPMASLPDDTVSDIENHSICDENPELLEIARDEEVKEERYSPPFRTLLAGMKVSPLLIVSKAGSTKKRVCTDMSYGSPSLNDLIDKEKIKVSFDSLISFAPYIVEKKKSAAKLVMWKSDVKNAYRLLPMAPQWQIRQIVKVAGWYHVDRCANFGSSASAKLWCAFFLLVLWIAEQIFGIRHLNNLMDDTWGVAAQNEMVLFKEKEIPRNQALLLLLFDKINVPWDWKKQLHGSELEVIGFWVEPNKLKFSLAPEKKSELISKIGSFIGSNQNNLREWQRLLGWCSWALNVFPLGRVALQSSWDKIAGKTHKRLVVPHNKDIQTDLRWLALNLSRSDGINLLEASLWSIAEADVVFAADACPSGIGIWVPESLIGYHAKIPLPSRDIYWVELLAVGNAIDIAIKAKRKKVVVCSDSENTCNLFLSHRAVPIVRKLFHHIIDSIITAQVDVRVVHVPGAKNVYADMLSRGQLEGIKRLQPKISLYQIPHPSSFPDGGIPLKPSKRTPFIKKRGSATVSSNRC